MLHLFCAVGPFADRESVQAAVGKARAEGDQVVTVSVLGHKADLAFMVLSEDTWRLRNLQTALVQADLGVVAPYVSLTETPESPAGVPAAMPQARLYPELPPEGKPAWCFYPMSKRRGEHENWYTLPYDDRLELMHEHGKSGRTFAGRVLQVVTGSTGVDDYEWGVALFGVRPDDLKGVVFARRYGRASARYGEFGPFYAGMVAELDDVLDSVGLGDEAGAGE